MTSLPRPFDPVKFLIARKFPMSRAALVEAANEPTEGDGAENPTLEAIKTYEEELRRMNKSQLDALVAQEQLKAAIEKNEREENARWFNHPAYNADFEHWSKMAYWTLEEGVSLTFGKDPESVGWENIKSLRQVSAFVVRYEKRLELANRAAALDALANTNIPGFFLAWAKRNDMEPPQRLLELAEKNGQMIADWPELLTQANKRVEEAIEWGKRNIEEAHSAGRKAFDDALVAWKADVEKLAALIAQLREENQNLRDESTKVKNEEPKLVAERERDSLLKLVICLAKEAYRHDHKAPRTTTAKEIASDLLKYGIPLDEDTVRKYLKEAANLLPPNEAEQVKR